MKPVDVKRIGMKISIGLYPNVFGDEKFGQQISKKEYLNNIKNISAFFSGNKNKIVKSLEKQMKTFADRKEFEKANKIKKQIFALDHINDITLIKEETRNIGRDFRIEAYDVAHLRGAESVGVMTVFENDKPAKNEYKKFVLRDTKEGDDYAGLREILTRRFRHDEWAFPDLIVIDGGKGQKNIANRLLKKLGVNVKVVSVVKDDKHNAREILAAGTNLKKLVQKHENTILQANLESHRFAINFHRSKMRKRLK
jgi:excinuclease ABC subunit C